MRVATACLLTTVAMLAGCQGATRWVPDKSANDLVSDSSVVSYKTSDGAHAAVWLNDKDLQLDDEMACQRRLVRFAAYRGGGSPVAKGNVAYAVSGDKALVAISIANGPRKQWALLEVPKGHAWLAYGQSLLRYVVKAFDAASDLAAARPTGWVFDRSVVSTKSLGDVVLPAGWFQMFDGLGGPPDGQERTLWLKGSKGNVEIAETTPDRLPHLGLLVYSGFHVDKATEGITRWKSTTYHDAVASVVRVGERIVVLVAGGQPDPHFVDESSQLAEFFQKKLQETDTAVHSG